MQYRCTECDSENVEITRDESVGGSGAAGRPVRRDVWTLCRACGHEDRRTTYPAGM